MALVVHVPGADGAFLASVTNGTNTAASNPYFTCRAAVSNTTAGAANFAYPLNETTGQTKATDFSGNTNPGLYTSGGVTYGVANPVCPHDAVTAITLDGSSGYISGPTGSVAGPNVFSIETWFKTSVAGGKLIGFGSSRTGTSTSYDRFLYIDSAGKLEFGVAPSSTKKTVASSSTVTDNKWHYAVGVLSAAGMVLYLDGTQVGINTTVTAGQSYSGFWRIGYDALSGWPNAPSDAYFTGSLAWTAEYNYALSATQVSQHYYIGTN